MTIITTGSTRSTATLDHRTGATLVGGPASRYHRVARCDGRPVGLAGSRPNFAARRLGALFLALSAVVAGAWLVGEVASGVGGRPVSAASGADAGVVISAGATSEDESGPVTRSLHVARDGDTLWSIADAYRGGVSRDSFVDDLVELNGGTSIHVGQAVHLP